MSIIGIAISTTRQKETAGSPLPVIAKADSSTIRADSNVTTADGKI